MIRYIKMAGLSALLALVCSASISAQSWHYGVKAGYSSANQDFSPLSSFANDGHERLSSITFGVFAEYALSPVASVRPEVNYVRKGSKYYVDEITYEYPASSGRSIDIGERIEYLSIPINIKFSYPTGQIRPYLVAGPRLDIRIDIDPPFEEALPPDTSSGDPSKVGTTEIIGSYKKYISGASIGGGVLFDLPSLGELLIEGVYQYDLTESMTYEDRTIDNSAWTITAGVRF